jgi:hypothetical protein
LPYGIFANWEYNKSVSELIYTMTKKKIISKYTKPDEKDLQAVEMKL